MSSDLILGIVLTSQKSRLLHLLFSNLGFKAHIRQPACFFEANLGEIRQLTVVKLTEKCFFDLVDVLNFHGLRLFLDFKLLKKSWARSTFTVLLLILGDNIHYVSSTEFSRVQNLWHCIVGCELSSDHLGEESSWEMSHNRVWEWVAIINLHISFNLELIAKIPQYKFQLNLIPDHHRRQLLGVACRG